MIYFLKFRLDGTGNMMLGNAPARGSMLNQADEDWDVVEVYEADVLVENPTPQTYVNATRRPVLDRIDAAAAQILAPLIPSPAQAEIYAAKEAEARNLDGTTPFLDAEASATGQAVADLATAVIANADATRATMVSVEAKRRAAKLAVVAAETIPAIIAAGVVDWQA